ncbi:hypothetical protein NDA16_001147 [Ustilago loliicola]|nr:hypothetical protein NDA16_001147 [Ustilago loliicola]
MSEAYSSNAPAASQQAQLNNEQNAEAGPSRPILPQPPKTDPIRDGYLDDWAKYSPLPSSAIPRDKIRGTDEPITDFFCSRALGEINDAELLRDVPLLGPPPQPGKGSIWYEPVPYWGMSSERCEFFVEKWRNEHDRVPVNSAVQANVERYHKLKAEGVHFNQVLMQNRSFKNPHVYAQLVNHLGIDETSSNLPSLDTSRYTGFWRSMFPFSEDELIEGDPIAISKQQEDEHLKKKLEQLHSNKRRNINFTRGSADQAATF